MMAMPSRNLGDLLVADGTETVLLLPAVTEPPVLATWLIRPVNLAYWQSDFSL